MPGVRSGVSGNGEESDLDSTQGSPKALLLLEADPSGPVAGQDSEALEV